MDLALVFVVLTTHGNHLTRRNSSPGIEMSYRRRGAALKGLDRSVSLRPDRCKVDREAVTAAPLLGLVADQRSTGDERHLGVCHLVVELLGRRASLFQAGDQEYGEGGKRGGAAEHDEAVHVAGVGG
jgi:hypothetical protein